jgi:hypothetical protein
MLCIVVTAILRLSHSTTTQCFSLSAKMRVSTLNESVTRANCSLRWWYDSHVHRQHLRESPMTLGALPFALRPSPLQIGASLQAEASADRDKDARLCESQKSLGYG